MSTVGDRLFDTIAAYYANVYYTHVYNSAYKRALEGGNINDEYAAVAKSYFTSIQNDRKCYDDTVESIRKFYKTFFEDISVNAMIDSSGCKLIPEDYQHHISSTQREALFSHVITKTAIDLGIYCSTSPMIGTITGNRTPESEKIYGTIIQEEASKIIERLQNMTKSQFMKAGFNVTDENAENSYRIKYAKAKEEIAKLKVNLHDADDDIDALKQKYKGIKREKEQLLDLVRLLKDKVEELSTQINTMQHTASHMPSHSGGNMASHIGAR